MVQGPWARFERAGFRLIGVVRMYWGLLRIRVQGPVARFERAGFRLMHSGFRVQGL